MVVAPAPIILRNHNLAVLSSEAETSSVIITSVSMPWPCTPQPTKIAPLGARPSPCWTNTARATLLTDASTVKSSVPPSGDCSPSRIRSCKLFTPSWSSYCSGPDGVPVSSMCLDLVWVLATARPPCPALWVPAQNDLSNVEVLGAEILDRIAERPEPGL
uniref:Uncharacterized protein n=1 Tax=uncultured marine virus TaxID=186617 RepID=A0A0F7L2B4_9VIRU|nr:hypothetical protein [uncultured marine virus]